MSDFGKYLKELREKRGLKVNQLSIYSGVSSATISRIENGKRGIPKPPTIKKLSAALKIPYPEMMEKAGYIDENNSSNVLYSKHQELTDKDERDIAKRMEKLREDLRNGEGLSFSGEPMSEEAIESLLEAMEYAERQTTRINKKYIPKKYRDK